MLNRFSIRLSLSITLGIALSIFVLVFFYALPFADDFCYGWYASADKPFVERFLEQYSNWDGRYSADALMTLPPLPMRSLWLYQLSLVLSLIVLLAVVFFFIYYWLRNIFQSIVVAVLFTLFYLSYQPDITEGVYWFTGIANYQLCNTLFLLQLTLLLWAIRAGNSSLLTCLSLISLVVAIGFNETAAFLLPVYYLLAASMAVVHKNNNRRVLVAHALVAMLAAGFVFFSQGNLTRAGEFPDRYKLLPSIYYSVLQTIRFTANWMLTVPFVLLSLLILFYAPYLQNSWLKRIDYRFIFLVLSGAVFTGAFLPYFATGILGQHRTINFVFFHFIFLWAWVLVSASERLTLPKQILFFNNPLARFYLLSFAIVIMIFSGNSFSILSDLKEGNFSRYKSGFMERQESVIAHPELPIHPLKDIPTVFRITDTKGDTSWWVDKCMMHYYSGTSLSIK